MSKKITLNQNKDLTWEFHAACRRVIHLSADAYVKSNIGIDIKNRPWGCHGVISVANMPGDRWSFVKTDDKGIVTEVAEKIRISDYASTGIYYFSNGKLFVSEAEQMIINKEKTKGKHYIIPLYQKYIKKVVKYYFRLLNRWLIWERRNLFYMLVKN